MARRASLVGRHPLGPSRIVHSDVDFALARLDWTDQPAAEWPTRLQEFLLADRRRGFDLGTAPAVRATPIRTGERDAELGWTFHHLLLDGWSMPVLVNGGFTA